MSDREDKFLEKEFDFSKAVKNPYAKALKKQVTINLDESVVSYFKEQSDSAGIPYQILFIFGVVFFTVLAYNDLAGRDTLYTHDIELTFKRYVISSIMRPPSKVAFLLSTRSGFE